MEHEKSSLITFKQFSEKYDWPSESAMRSYYIRKKKIGLSDAFFKFNGRVLVDPYKFFELIRTLSNQSSE